jgi:hypothetical protein
MIMLHLPLADIIQFSVVNKTCRTRILEGSVQMRYKVFLDPNPNPHPNPTPTGNTNSEGTPSTPAPTSSTISDGNPSLIFARSRDAKGLSDDRFPAEEDLATVNPILPFRPDAESDAKKRELDAKKRQDKEDSGDGEDDDSQSTAEQFRYKHLVLSVEDLKQLEVMAEGKWGDMFLTSPPITWMGYKGHPCHYDLIPGVGFVVNRDGITIRDLVETWVKKVGKPTPGVYLYNGKAAGVDYGCVLFNIDRFWSVTLKV